MATVTETDVEATVKESLVEFGAEEADINREATFEALEIDSLDLAELAQIVDEKYGVALKGADIEQIKTVGDAIDMIVSRAS